MNRLMFVRCSFLQEKAWILSQLFPLRSHSIWPKFFDWLWKWGISASGSAKNNLWCICIWGSCIREFEGPKPARCFTLGPGISRALRNGNAGCVHNNKCSNAKVPVFSREKMALWVPEQKNGDHFLMPTSPQNGVGHVCFMRLALLGGI